MFSPIKNTKVYEQVIVQIKNMIANGTLKRGDKLPSERDLVEELGVSRTSIREALRALEVIGLIECRQGEGNFINSDFQNSLFEPLSIMFMLQESSPSEIVELRKIIETETAALAANNITDVEVSEIKVLIERLKESTDENNSAAIDKEFHYMIAKASRNFLVVSILEAVSGLIDTFIKDARRKILTEEANKEKLIVQHEDVYKALLSHDSDAAARAMADHLEFANEYMNKL